MPQGATKGVNMCGIAGVANNGGNAANEVYSGLQRLEYRGYDSAGIAALYGGKIYAVKRKGRGGEQNQAIGN